MNGRNVTDQSTTMRSESQRKRSPKDQNLVSYLNSIDFSLVGDEAVIENIYKEIHPAITNLFKDPFASTSLEKLISLSSPAQLIGLLNSLEKNTVHKKLGSRIVEKVYERLFECMYKEECSVCLKDALCIFSHRDSLRSSIVCHNATFVVRKVLMLLSGKRIDKLSVQKYKKHTLDNERFSREMLEEIKVIFKELLAKISTQDCSSFYSADFFNTLGVFLQVTKSQSLIECLIQNDCDIQSKGFLYEIIPTVSNKKNLRLIYSKIKGKCKDLALAEKSSYFMQSFLRHSLFGREVYEELSKDGFEGFDSNSNIILALAESLQKCQEYELVNDLLSRFYKPSDSLFEELLLSKYGSLDSKFVNVVTNFMQLPRRKGYEHFYSVNEDFTRLFKREWIRSKSGIALLLGFVKGSSDPETKGRFLERNIDLLWKCVKWREGKEFARTVCDLTKGHARKKAFEILKRIDCP